MNAPDESFKLWEKPADYKSRGRPAFQAASATLEAAATEAGLDLEQFRQDVADTAAWDQMRVDFEHGKNEHGVFGTPTIMFENGQGAYLKLNPKQLPDDPVEFFYDFVDTVRDRPAVMEIKRPAKVK